MWVICVEYSRSASGELLDQAAGVESEFGFCHRHIGKAQWQGHHHKLCMGIKNMRQLPIISPPSHKHYSLCFLSNYFDCLVFSENILLWVQLLAKYKTLTISMANGGQSAGIGGGACDTSVSDWGRNFCVLEEARVGLSFSQAREALDWYCDLREGERT